MRILKAAENKSSQWREFAHALRASTPLKTSAFFARMDAKIVNQPLSVINAWKDTLKLMGAVNCSDTGPQALGSTISWARISKNSPMAQNLFLALQASKQMDLFHLHSPVAKRLHHNHC